MSIRLKDVAIVGRWEASHGRALGLADPRQRGGHYNQKPYDRSLRLLYYQHAFRAKPSSNLFHATYFIKSVNLLMRSGLVSPE